MLKISLKKLHSTTQLADAVLASQKSRSARLNKKKSSRSMRNKNRRKQQVDNPNSKCK